MFSWKKTGMDKDHLSELYAMRQYLKQGVQFWNSRMFLRSSSSSHAASGNWIIQTVRYKKVLLPIGHWMVPKIAFKVTAVVGKHVQRLLRVVAFSDESLDARVLLRMWLRSNESQLSAGRILRLKERKREKFGVRYKVEYLDRYSYGLLQQQDKQKNIKEINCSRICRDCSFDNFDSKMYFHSKRNLSLIKKENSTSNSKIN